MDIKLLGWSSRGLRCPDMDIRFDRGEGREGEPPLVALVQMPNGTGKTTTLELIRASLSGAATSWSGEVVADYQSRTPISEEGTFVLHVKVGESVISFEIAFDFSSNSVGYRTTRPDAGGIFEGHRPPDALKRYLAKDFLSLVIFDGELAKELLDAKTTRAEAAIDALCQLDLFDQLSSIANLSWKEAKATGALSDAQIARKREVLETKEQDKDNVKRSLEKAHVKLNEYGEDLTKLDENMEEELKKHERLRGEMDEAARKCQVAEEKYDRAINELMGCYRDPYSLSEKINEGLVDFKRTLDKAKLPESSSKQFFEEIVQEERCICGTPFTEEMREEVHRRKAKYLGSEITSTLNSIKENISRFLDEDVAGDIRLGEKISSARLATEADVRAKNEKELAKKRLSGPGAEEVRAIEQKKGKIYTEMEKVQDAIETLEPRLEKLDKEVALLSDELAEAQGARSLKMKVDILNAICEDAKEITRDIIKNKLVDECNDHLAHILADNPVRISNIDNAISLQGQSAASVGQTLAVGYTFLTSLFEKSDYSFPFIVDSPANPIDTKVRREVGALIPRLVKQFVAFTISSERAGFMEGLETTAKEDILFMTVYRSDTDTNAAVVEMGKEAFEQFHQDRESANV